MEKIYENSFAIQAGDFERLKKVNIDVIRMSGIFVQERLKQLKEL